MYQYRFYFTLILINCVLSISRINSQSQNVYNTDLTLAQASGHEAMPIRNVPHPAVEIINLYDYDKTSLTEYYVKKMNVNHITHDLFYLLQSNDNLIIDTLFKSITWKGKDFLEVYVNGKKLPYNERHLYYYLKNLKSIDFNGLELIGYNHPKYKNGFNVGMINIIK